MRIGTVLPASLLLALAACAQPAPEPAPVMPEPVYDKYGNDRDGGGCTGQAGAAPCYPLTTQPPQPGGGQPAGQGQAAGSSTGKS